MRATLPLPGLRTWSSDVRDRREEVQPRGRGWWWRGRQPWVTVPAVLVAVGGSCALIEGPLWHQSVPLAAANLAVSMLLVFAGLLIRDEPGQRGVAWALMLVGVLRSLDFVDAWDAGPLAVYTLIFGGMDRLFGAWALLRYPNFSLPKYQRLYLALLAGWMLIGRTLIAVTSTAQWNGGSGSWWWPSLMPNLRLTDTLNYVVNAGEGIFAVVLVVLLVMRLLGTSGLDRIVITPVIVAGLAAVIAAGASAVTQMLVSLNTTPNNAYVTESAIDLAVPLAFLIAITQRALLLRNITGLAAQITDKADVDSV